uniref:Uncharacterized protein n=1 Tax=Sphenodon punctatus TaxID=8508 RepID=A0A8D0L4N6_SPHPU
MPSDFISLLSADLDLESPKSLYSKESVYDLLPKELQLPPSRETSVASMSQTSGGEAGSPPPAVVAAGKDPTLLWVVVKVCINRLLGLEIQKASTWQRNFTALLTVHVLPDVF